MATQISSIMRLKGSVGTIPLVGFQIGGAQKCGTHALFSSLYGQPGLALAIRKETKFFVNDRYFSIARRRDEIAQDYGLFFPIHTVGQIAGEGTPEYMWHPSAAERIRSYNPQTRWIICLRNPVARAYSQWKMMIRNGVESRDFLPCLKASLASLDQTQSIEEQRAADPRGLLTRGLYVSQIDRIVSLFGEDQVFVLFTANLRYFHRMTVNNVVAFLKDGSKAHNTSIIWTAPKQYSEPCSESLDLLCAFYADEIVLLEEKLHCDLSIWRDRPSSD